MSATSSAATHIGRIGGLAVALGVGAAIASGAGAAWADSADSSSSSTSSSSSSAGSTGKDRASKGSTSTTRSSTGSSRDRSPKSSSPTKGDSTSGDSTSGDSTGSGSSKGESSKGGSADRGSSDKTGTRSWKRPSSSTDAAESAPGKPARTATNQTRNPDAKTSAPKSGTLGEVSDSSVAQGQSVSVAVPTERTVTSARAVKAQSAAATALTEAVRPTETQSQAAPTRTPLVTRLLSAFGVNKPAATTPVTPKQSPAAAALLALVRREAERTGNPTAVAEANAAYAAAAVVPWPSRLDSRRVGWVTGPGITNTPGGFNIYGTDLGIMWDGGTINGQRFVHVAFGDTFSGPNMQGGWRNNVLLISFDDRLDNGLTLAPTGPAFQFIPRSKGQVGPFGSEVTVIPTAGINVNGTQYVNYMSVRSWDTPGRWTTNYSAISQFHPGADGGSWQIVGSTIRSSGWFRSSTPYRPGDQNFQQMAYVLQPESQVADGDPRYLYAFGTPSGRAGSAYLSRVVEGSVTDLSKYEYWDGNKWVTGNAAVAKPIVGTNKSSGLFGFVKDWANDPKVFGGYLGGLFGPKTGGNVSEMSVQYNEYLDKYVMLYGDGNNNIQMRVADTPESAWSDPIQLASSAQYPGLYAPFIHPWSGTGLLVDNQGNADYQNLYWNMSLWGPYNVVLMQTDLSSLQPVQV